MIKLMTANVDLAREPCFHYRGKEGEMKSYEQNEVLTLCEVWQRDNQTIDF